MNTGSHRTLLRLAILLPVLLAANAVRANRTNLWDFGTNTVYEVSNPRDIEVADGVAKLRLQASQVHVSDLARYLSTGAVWDALSFGPDVLLTLAQTNGAYVPNAQYVSRVYDGGLGNRWDAFQVSAYNAELQNAGNELTTNSSKIRLLLPYNNSWVDSVSGVAGAPNGNASFSVLARSGSHSARFSSSGYSLHSMNATLSKATFVFWIYPERIGAGVVEFAMNFIRNGNYQGGVEIGGKDGSNFKANNIELWTSASYANTAIGTFSDSDLNQWVHIAIVFDGQRPLGQRVQFYKNGSQIATERDTTPSIFDISQIAVGGRPGALQGIIGCLDEVAVFDDVLSQPQIYSLYKRPQSLLFQVRSGSSHGQIQTLPFVGPDGSAQSFYSRLNMNLTNSALFSRVERFIQYKAWLIGQADGKETPFIDAVGIVGTRASAFDNTLGDFVRAESFENLLLLPNASERAQLGLSKKPSGGFERAGVFTSRTLDGGGQVFWDVLRWGGATEQTVEVGMRALWHANGGWADATGNGFNGRSVSNIFYSTDAKLGANSAVFNGVNSTVMFDIHTNLAGSPNFTNAVGSLGFWIKANREDAGLFDFGAGRQVRISRRLVAATGFGASVPQVFVNGQPNSRGLQSGWNHVAVTWTPAFNATAPLVIGCAGADYFEGVMDEISLYSVPINGGRLKAHYLQGGGGDRRACAFSGAGRKSEPNTFFRAFRWTRQLGVGLFHGVRNGPAVRCLAETLLPVSGPAGW